MNPPSTARPNRLLVVAGTGTEVGKTWVAARLLAALRSQGCSVAARKPAQSFDPGDDALGTTDAQLLGAASGEEPATVCPARRWYPVAMAPPMAAEHLGLPPVTLADLAAELVWPDPAVDVGVVETAGGVHSPLAEDGDTVDLCRMLRPTVVVLVADAGLGTINAVRLGAGALAAHPLVVVVNRFDAEDELHRRNASWLTERDGLSVFTTPTGATGGLGALAEQTLLAPVVA